MCVFINTYIFVHIYITTNYLWLCDEKLGSNTYWTWSVNYWRSYISYISYNLSVRQDAVDDAKRLRLSCVCSCSSVLCHSGSELIYYLGSRECCACRAMYRCLGNINYTIPAIFFPDWLGGIWDKSWVCRSTKNVSGSAQGAAVFGLKSHR